MLILFFFFFLGPLFGELQCNMSPKMKTCLSLEATSRGSIAQIEVESQQQVIKGSEV